MAQARARKRTCPTRAGTLTDETGELRDLNKKVWAGKNGASPARSGLLTGPDVFATKPPLDTSFKKNTAVIKRLRTSLTPDNLTSILRDIATVSLEKYLSEVI